MKTRHAALMSLICLMAIGLGSYKVFASFGQNPKAFGIMGGIQQIGVGSQSVNPTWPLEIGGSWTAKSGVADGVSVYPNLVAAANSDVLTAVAINPTFTPGSFTSVSKVGLAVTAGTVVASNGYQIATTVSIPTCAAATRGTLWVVQGGTGVTDTLEVCLKAAANTYSWVSVITGG